MLPLALRSHASSAYSLMGQHKSCESQFRSCWDPVSLSWKPGSPCSTAHHCTKVLCFTWLEANCTEMASMCPEVNEMCRTLAPVHNMGAAMSLRYGAKSKHRSSSGGSAADTDTDLYEKPQEESLVFAHIPKNAGTAVENAGWESLIRWGRYRMYYFGMVPMPDDIHWCGAHHVPPKMLPASMQSIYSQSKVFCVIRDPYRRAVSEYKYLLSVPWGMNKPGVLDMEPCTKEGLNFFLRKALTTVVEGMQFVNDCHMLPQTEFVYDGDRQWCTEVLRIEDMPSNFNSLMEREGYSVHLSTIDNDSKAACPGLGVQDLDNDTILMLNEVYREDFNRLGFERMSTE